MQLPPTRRFNKYDPVRDAGISPVRMDCCPFDLVEVYQWARLDGGRYGESPGWDAAEYEMCFVEHKNGTEPLLQPQKNPVTGMWEPDWV